MRTAGVDRAVTGLGLHDHACLYYHSDKEFRQAAAAFLADGLAAGQRLMYVARRPRDRMLADLEGLGDAGPLVAGGALVLESLGEMYRASGPFKLDEQLARYEAARAAAIAGGYTGLRVLVDSTEIARVSARRADHLRWEHRADQYMADGNEVVALCAFDARRVSIDEIASLATAHPTVVGSADLGACRAYFDDGLLHVAGTVDSYTQERLSALLSVSHLRARDAVRLDMSQVDFIDARGLYALAHWGGELADGGGALVIEGARPLPRRMWELLDLGRMPHVRMGGEQP